MRKEALSKKGGLKNIYILGRRGEAHALKENSTGKKKTKIFESKA